MLLRQDKSKFFSSKFSSRKLFIFVIALLFVSYSLVIFIFGASTYRYEMANGKPIITEIKSTFEKLTSLKNYSQALTTDIELIKIDIKHKDFQRLAYDRQVGLDKSRLFENVFVPAEISHNGQVYKIRTRLKGDFQDHFQSPSKWSLRVEIKDKDKSLMGMTRFSLQSPKTRNYLYEWLYHKLLKREDIIALKYDFVKVEINGKDLGIYAIEEHFDKVLIESNNRREGPILKLNEDILWKENSRARGRGHGGDFPSTIIELINPGAFASDDSSSNIEAFNTKNTLNNQNLKKQFIFARDLLELFRRGDLKTSQVFDIERLAKFFALSELTRTLHGAFVWNNLRFYYNPVTSLLEPIGFNGHAGGMHTNSMWASEGIQESSEYDSSVNFYLQIFKDMEFFEKYIYYIEKYSEPTFIDQFFDEFEPIINEKLNILYRDFPQIDNLGKMKSVFKKTQNVNRFLIYPSSGIHAYEEKYLAGNMTISIGNIQMMPIEIIGIKTINGELIQPKDRLIIEPKLKKSAVKYNAYNFKINETNYSSNLNIIYKVLGTSKLNSSIIFPYPITSSNNVDIGFMNRISNVSEFKFIQIDEPNKKITIKPGKWEIDKDLIIPSEYSFHIGADTHINLSNGATILSYSPVKFKGEAKRPIIINSLDGLGQGLSIINAKNRSFLQYVNFNNLSAPSKENWNLSGAVNFYESPVSISNVFFENSKAEDALNIIRSNFLIQNSGFINNQFDSFDGDFVEGIITNTIFHNSGNDGIDISGSSIKIENVEISGINDKSISAGENSNVKIINSKIINSNIALASKDQSSINASKLIIINSNIALTAYQKKSEFGPASISVDKLNTDNIKILYMLENKSKLIIDGNLMEPNAKSVYETLYGQ